MSRYLAAGYTHLITYQVWMHIAHEWVESRIPTTKDALDAHLHALDIRRHHREVRDVLVTALVAELPRPTPPAPTLVRPR